MKVQLRKDRDEASSGSGRLARGLPRLPSPAAAAAVGLLCAVLSMLLVYLGERGCDAVRGTPSCGAAGVLLLAVTGAVVLFAGLVLLRLLDTHDPGMTNFLGFALFLMVLMTALLDRLFSSMMWIVLPLLGAATYAAGAAISRVLTRISQS